MSCGSKTKEIDFQFWFDMKSKTNPNLTNVMALPLHFKSTNYAMVCSVFGRHEQYSSRDPTQLIGHCNKLWLFWIGEKWKITHSRSGPGAHGMWWSVAADRQSAAISVPVARISRILFLIHNYMTHDENESRIIIMGMIYMFIHSFIQRREGLHNLMAS